MDNPGPKMQARKEWTPARVLWLAHILVHDGTEPAALRITATAWCTDGEALFFLQRRLPTTDVPAGLPARSRVYGLLVPAKVTTKMVDGQVIQEFEPDRAAARYAVVDDKGRLVWSATQLNLRR